jgi:hypothetical protein
MWREINDRIILKNISEKNTLEDISKSLNISVHQLHVRIGQLTCFFVLKGGDISMISETMNLSPQQINHCIQIYSNPPCETNEEMNYMYKIHMIKNEFICNNSFEEYGFWCFKMDDCVDNLLRRLQSTQFKNEINEWLDGSEECVCTAHIISNDCEYSIVKRMIDVVYKLETCEYDQKLNKWFFIKTVNI